MVGRINKCPRLVYLFTRMPATSYGTSADEGVIISMPQNNDDEEEHRPEDDHRTVVYCCSTFVGMTFVVVLTLVFIYLTFRSYRRPVVS